jgi:hypothetical protein
MNTTSTNKDQTLVNLIRVQNGPNPSTSLAN